MKVWGITDVGLKRHENQDSYAFEPFGVLDSVAAVVCDGMGGVSGGRIASTLAVSKFLEEMNELRQDGMTVEQVREMQSACVKRANSAVFERSRESEEYYGMGTTLVSAVVSPELAVICNVGDSRAYHINADGIHRVTRDHSVVEDMVESGEITREEARNHPNRNLITRALGPGMNLNCDTFVIPLAEGDRLLLCTDGLTGTMLEDEIRQIVNASLDGGKALEQLVALSKSRGAPDNVTAVLILNEREEARDNG